MPVSAVSAVSNYYQAAGASGTLTVAAALTALRDNPRARVRISDTASEVTQNFDALARLSNSVTSLTVTDAADSSVSITGAQYVAHAGRLMTKFAADSRFEVAGIAASRATVLQNDSRVRAFSVRDNSTELSSRLSALKDMGKLTTVEVSTPQTLISLTAQQYNTLAQADNSILDRITTGSAGVAITTATAAEAVGFTGDARVRSVSVLDSASGIVAKLSELRDLGARLRGIRSSDATQFSVSAQQVQQNALVIGKLYRGYELNVTGASVSEVAALAANRRVISIDIEDTAANVAANIDQLATLGSDLGRIHLTDEGAKNLNLSSRQFSTQTVVLNQIDTNDYTVSISAASVQEAQTLAANPVIASMTVVDSAAAVTRGWTALQAMGDRLSSISLVGRSQPLQISAAGLAGASALGKIQGQYTLAVTGASAAGALGLVTAPNSRVVSITVSDSGANLLGKLQDMAMLGKRLTSIQVTDAATPLALSVSDWTTHMGTLAKIQGGYGVALSGVSASNASAMAADPRVRTVSVTDTAAAISAKLDELHDLGSALQSVVRTDAAAVRVTGRQYATQATTLAKLGNDYTLSLQQATAEQATQLGALSSRVVDIAVLDTNRNIANRLDGLQDAISSDATRQWTIRTAGANASTLALTAQSYVRNADALAALAGAPALYVSAAAIDQVSTLSGDRRVSGVSVSATASELSDADKLGVLAGLGSRLLRVTQSDPAEALTLTATQWEQFRTTLDKAAGGVRVSLSDVTAAQVASLSGDWRVKSVAVRDSGAQIVSSLQALQAAGPLVSSIEQSDAADGSMAISMRQFREQSSVFAKLGAASSIRINGASAAEAQQLAGVGYDAVTAVSVLDTAQAVAAALSDLQANTKLSGIALSNPSVPMVLSKDELDQYSDLLSDRMQGGYRLSVTGVAAADASTLAGRIPVVSMAVTGSAEEVAAHLSALTAAGPKVASISMTAPAAMLLDVATWQTHQATLAKVRTPYSVTVTGVMAAQAGTVASSPSVSGVTVSDTGANIARSLDALQALGSKLGALTTTDASPPTLAIRADQAYSAATTLGKVIDGRYNLSVSGATAAQALTLAADAKVLSVAVTDSSSNIASRLADLAGLGSRLTTITQSGTPEPLAMTAEAYAQYASTRAKIQGAYSMVVASAAVDAASGLQGDGKVQSFTLRDTTTHIGTALSTLSAMNRLTGIELSADDGPITLTETQLTTLQSGLDLLEGSTGSTYRLHVTGVAIETVADVAATQGVSTVAVATASQALSESIDDLAPLGDRLTAITLSDLSTPVALTHPQWLTRGAVLDKIQGNYQLALLEVPVEAASDAASGAKVATISVQGSAAMISAHFNELAALGDKVDQVEVSDSGDIVITPAHAQSAEGSALIDKIVGEHEVVIEG